MEKQNVVRQTHRDGMREGLLPTERFHGRG